MKGIGEITTKFCEIATPGNPLRLKCGVDLGRAVLAYETYGQLSRGKDNAVLVFHALSGSAHAAGENARLPEAEGRWTGECRKGWWDEFIGPGKALDTRKLFVICANYLGGCYGSTGPASIDPVTRRRFGSQFPEISLSDIVDSQLRLLDSLGVQELHGVVGGSLGGMLSLNLATRYPERVRNVIVLASGLEVTVLQMIHNFEQILAIEADPEFRGGDYYEYDPPKAGLALARMMSHKTFVSLNTMEERARREIAGKGRGTGVYRLRYPIESYMLHQGEKFVERFDANSYLRIVQMWQNASLLQDHASKTYAEIFSACREQKYMIFSIDSDVCYYPEEQMAIVSALKSANVPFRYVTVHSEKGHDSFLLEPELFAPHIADSLAVTEAAQSGAASGPERIATPRGDVRWEYQEQCWRGSQ